MICPHLCDVVSRDLLSGRKIIYVSCDACDVLPLLHSTEVTFVSTLHAPSHHSIFFNVAIVASENTLNPALIRGPPAPARKI